jgi:hypothetical protein
MHSLYRARHLLVSDHGRRDGWYVDLDGRTVGDLGDVRSEEMFWDSYAVTAESEASASTIRDDSLWNACRFTFRNRLTGDVVTTALCGGHPPFVRDGRVLIRGLYLVPTGLVQRLILRGLTILRPRRP